MIFDILKFIFCVYILTQNKNVWCKFGQKTNSGLDVKSVQINVHLEGTFLRNGLYTYKSVEDPTPYIGKNLIKIFKAVFLTNIRLILLL